VGLLEVFMRNYSELPQQGPGSDASTLRALEMARPLPEAPRVLDLGCGTGRSTLALAAATLGSVTAVDLDAGFLDRLAERATERELSSRIQTRCGSIAELVEAEASCDLIWSEGAAYTVGTEHALAHWAPRLAAGGALAFSELSWLCDDPPQEARAFWEADYPPMSDRAGNLHLIERAGLRLVADFVLPEADWHAYYGPLLESCDRLAAEHGTASPEDESIRNLIAQTRVEAALYDRFSDSYGYIFYVTRRSEDV